MADGGAVAMWSCQPSQASAQSALSPGGLGSCSYPKRGRLKKVKVRKTCLRLRK